MRKSLTPMGETEMEVLNHVWDMGEASVGDVRERVLQKRQVAYTTIMTVMKNLHNKGYLKYRKQGMSYIYSASMRPDEVRFKLLERLLDKVFLGSTGHLVQTLVESEELSGRQMDELRDMIKKLND
ncbi:MAG: BlaI/MecI/CopY family transcriptional regulator [Balneolaceae bacterium]